ncbi:MAG: YicC family protein [Alistipes sp.]|nr:YicC family protein [Alistipes sp.]
MTGFGKAEVRVCDKKFTAEIRSLNSKQLDLSVKLPMAYRAAEFDIRSAVAKVLVRGKVDVMVSVESDAVQTPGVVNNEIFREYLRQVTDALSYSGIDAAYDSIVPAVLRMPNVMSTPTDSVSDEELAAIVEAVNLAAQRLDAFRVQEGEILIADLLNRVTTIEQCRDAITPFESARADAVRDRIREGIAKLGVEVDENRLEQEMIFYIEKLDITEEKVRLANHCKYFREVAATEPMAGRKLGFIAQEMGREINTTGSKANNHDIQVLVVKMKDELEKIKEQVLNIL